MALQPHHLAVVNGRGSQLELEVTLVNGRSLLVGRIEDFSRFKDNQDIWVNPSI